MQHRETTTRSTIERTTHCAHPLDEAHGAWNVPCVRAVLDPKDDAVHAEPRWWPIIGPWHEDGALLGFATYHFHIDWRFVDRASRRTVSKRGMQARGEVAQVIIARHIVPVGATAPRHSAGWTTRAEERTGGCARPLPDADTARWFRRETREPATLAQTTWWRHTEWRGALEEAFEGSRLVGPERRCPHRGVPLAHIAPDAEGIVECPLHGLRWCARTGTHVPDITL